MSDFSAYREKVANYGKAAHQAETDQNYELAYENYTKALDIFMHMIKCKLSIDKAYVLQKNNLDFTRP